VDGDNRVVAQATAAPEPGQPGSLFSGPAEFCGRHYRELVRAAMYAGATKEEAKAAVSAALEDVVRNWPRLVHPLKWAKKAVINHFLKEKERDLERTRRRLVEKRAGTAQGRHDGGLNLWEERQWVMQLLKTLPRKQAEVMAMVVDDFTPTEIAELLGRSPEAVRQSLREARQRLKRALQQERAGERFGRAASSSRKGA
jgi:RNA polymerase sigma factor (sigma-70 family)